MNATPIDKERVMPRLAPGAVSAGRKAALRRLDGWKAALRRLDGWTRRP